MVYTMRLGPARFYIEAGAIAALSEFISNSRVLVISGKTAWERAGPSVERALAASGSTAEVRYVGRECYRELAEGLARRCGDQRAGWVIGVGGGKVMDLAKLVGELAGIPVALIPTTPATCACWTALSVVYDKEGAHPSTHELEHGPHLTLADLDILAGAPARHIASGVLDALAKWYEISSAADGVGRRDPSVIAALDVARLCRDLLFQRGPEAVAVAGRGRLNDALRQTIWASIVLPGLSSGLVGERYRFSVAHGFYNHLTRIENARRTSLHGEQVGFGIAVQMLLMKPSHPELEDFMDLRHRLGSPLTLEELGIRESDLEALREVVSALAADPGVRSLPFPVTEAGLWDAIREIDRRGESLRSADPAKVA